METKITERLKVEWLATRTPYNCYREWDLKVTTLNGLNSDQKSLEAICGHAGFSGQGFQVCKIEKIPIDKWNHYTVYYLEISCDSGD